jgi:hypothetical protein
VISGDLFGQVELRVAFGESLIALLAVGNVDLRVNDASRG